MGGDDDDDLFERAMSGVKKITRIAKGSRRRPLPPEIDPTRASAVVPLAIDDDGDFVSGRAPGVSRKQLQTLCRAAWPDEEIDLHGLKRAEAARELSARMTAAARNGKAVVLVIHGKGTHSPDAHSVLRGVTLETLQSSALSGLVSGFATAASRHGGRGALYVFLKKA